MDFIQTFLAGFLDKFKAKNPMIYGLIVVVLMTIMYAADQAVAQGVLSEGQVPWLARAIEILSQILIVVTGSRTVRYMGPPKDSPAQLKSNPDYND